MILNTLKKIFGTANDRTLRSMRAEVVRINDLEAQIAPLSDDALRAKTAEFKQRLANGAPLDSILHEAFAVVRETGKRTLGERHFDVQMIGGLVLHRGMIAEMKTGEGKTLVSTLPTYLNALTGKGVHLVTVNDYLAKRDAAWMSNIYNFLDLSVGTIVHGLNDDERRDSYAADITYGTNNEFGFDYLRDNMKFSLDDVVQRPFNFAIVDEVDSILIDEARTPLIISGPAEDSSELYAQINEVIPLLEPQDYEKDEKQRNVTLTDSGVERIEMRLDQMGLLKSNSLYDIQNIALVHHVNQALKAHKMFSRDVDYIVKDDKVIIIDEFTGRMMDGRRYSEGLHQALEAKEKVTIEMENQTLASITFQNYFRLYPKLAGMTGTAATEAEELMDIYKLNVVEIPTNRPIQRKDLDDEVYRTAREKNDAMIKLIRDCHERKQPVLVGTVSIEKSEALSELLKKAKIPHQVLNARYHEKESLIVASAGEPGAVTIATNMAGRGTDIKLGGNVDVRTALELGEMAEGATKEKAREKIRAEIAKANAAVKDNGGLYIIGTERHESRRIDNQLRGRAGRQGDPGASKFFLSLEDDLMRIFGSDKLGGMLERLGMQEGEAISHTWINKALMRAQQKVEARNYDIRKQLLRYDDVMNDQRKIIYEQRRDLMQTNDISDMIQEIRADVLEHTFRRAVPMMTHPDAWDMAGLHEEMRRIFALDLPLADWVAEEGMDDRTLMHRLTEAVDQHFAEKETRYGAPTVRMAEKNLLLRTLDHLWKDHLLQLDHLRQAINLRAYAQTNPLHEYKREAFNLFQGMMDHIREQTIAHLAHFEMSLPDGIDIQQLLALSAELEGMEESLPTGWLTDVDDAGIAPEAEAPQLIHVQPSFDPNDSATWQNTVQRNAPCPCGSGKKFKHCHGRLDSDEA